MFDEAIINLSRANDLAQQQKQNFGDEVASMLRIAKRGRWQKMEKERIKQEIELQTYLNNLITKDRDQELQQLDENKSDGKQSRKKLCIKINLQRFCSRFKRTGSRFCSPDTFLTPKKPM